MVSALTPTPTVEEVAEDVHGWQSSVMQVMPHVSQDRIGKAVASLNTAILAAQESEALERLANQADQAGYDPAFQEAYQAAVEVMRARLNGAQQQNVQEVHALCMQECFHRAWLAMAQQQQCAVPAMPTPFGFADGFAPPFLGMPMERPCYAPADMGCMAGFEEHDPYDARKPQKVQTLATSLQVLSQEDPRCIFIVRRINKLGFKAPRKLKSYFQGFGHVVRILVAHSTVRQSCEPKSMSRRRPSSLGFVQMRRIDDVQKVLALGKEQQVDGITIVVQQFERLGENDLEEEDEVPAAPSTPAKLHACGQRARIATASTTASERSYDANADSGDGDWSATNERCRLYSSDSY